MTALNPTPHEAQRKPLVRRASVFRCNKQEPLDGLKVEMLTEHWAVCRGQAILSIFDTEQEADEFARVLIAQGDC